MGEAAYDRGEFQELVRGDGDEVNGDWHGGRVMEWEIGLPSADDLTPLSQPMVPPHLSSAFSISPEPARTILDVHRASQTTLSSLRRKPNQNPNPNPDTGSNPNPRPFPSFPDDPKFGQPENKETEISTDDQSARSLKRPRLVWTPQLHKRFVEVITHIGITNAVPKTIMQLMNVEGLTRENVASHLQKYRLYLKRMQGLSNEGPSPSDQLFSSTPVPQSLQQEVPALVPPHQQQQPVPMYPIPYPMPMYHDGHMGMGPMDTGYQHYGGFASNPPSHRVTPNDR